MNEVAVKAKPVISHMLDQDINALAEAIRVGLGQVATAIEHVAENISEHATDTAPIDYTSELNGIADALSEVARSMPSSDDDAVSSAISGPGEISLIHAICNVAEAIERTKR